MCAVWLSRPNQLLYIHLLIKWAKHKEGPLTQATEPMCSLSVAVVIFVVAAASFFFLSMCTYLIYNWARDFCYVDSFH